MPDPNLRAADSERAAVATTLGRAMADGRLTVAEYDERLAAAYASRTYGELATLTADLPGTGSSPAPTTAAHSPAPACGGGSPGLGRPAWGSWGSTALIVLSIWAVTSVVAQEFLYFWPFWVIVPWGGMLLMGTLGARGGRPDRQLSS